MYYVGGLKHTKDVILTCLRQFFNNPNNYSNLLPEQMPENIFTAMNIYDTHPQSLRTFPMIVVAQSNGRYASHALSNDFASEVYADDGEVIGYMYAGFYDFSFEVEIGTKATLEREVLMDITSSALRWNLRRRMEYHGVIVKDVSYGGENKIQYDSDFIYTSLINMQTYSEWHEYYNLLPVTEINVDQKMINPFNKNEKKEKKTWYIPTNADLEVEKKEDANYHMYDRSKKYYNSIVNQYT